MKKIIPFILLAFTLASCSETKPFLVGKNHQMVWGNPRIKWQNEQKKIKKLGAREFANEKTNR